MAIALVNVLLVFDYAARYKEGIGQLREWLRAGKIKYRETIVDGIENAPRAFIGMLQGQNIGKQLVKVSEPELAFNMSKLTTDKS